MKTRLVFTTFKAARHLQYNYALLVFFYYSIPRDQNNGLEEISKTLNFVPCETTAKLFVGNYQL